MADPPRAMTLRSAAALVVLVLVAGALRLGVFELARPVGLLGDENYYVEVAGRIAQGEGHLYVGGMEGESRAWRPPGHAWWLSLFVPGDRADAAKPQDDPRLVEQLQRTQLWLSTLVVLLTALLGRALFDSRTGRLAGVLAAVYPALLAQSHSLWSETWFTVQLLAALLAAVHCARHPTPARVALTGLLFGVAALTRELALVAAGACGVWWIARDSDRGAAALRAGAALALAVAVTLPWMLRNHEELGRWVGTSTVGWFALAEGNSLEHPDWWERRGPVQAGFHAKYFSTRDEVARLDVARSHALDRIVAEQPDWLVRKTLRNLALLLNPDTVLRTKVRNGAYGDRPRPAARWLLAVSGVAWLALASVAALGVAAARADGRRLLAVLLLGGVAAVHIAANATPRFRVPWLPLLCVYAAHAAWLGRRVWGPLDLRGVVGVGLAIALLFGIALPYYWLLGGRP